MVVLMVVIVVEVVWLHILTTRKDVNFASSEDLFAADQLLLVGRERDPEGAEATAAGSQDDNDLDDYDEDDCKF